MRSGEINMSENLKNTVETGTEIPQKIDVVVLHTNTILANSLAEMVRRRGKTAHAYHTGEKLLENFEKYAKDTKFCFNYSLEGGLTGKDVAIKLHDAGYTKLYLYSGWVRSCIEEFDLPDYLQMVLYYESPDPIKELIDLLCE